MSGRLPSEKMMSTIPGMSPREGAEVWVGGGERPVFFQDSGSHSAPLG